MRWDSMGFHWRKLMKMTTSLTSFVLFFQWQSQLRSSCRLCTRMEQIYRDPLWQDSPPGGLQLRLQYQALCRTVLITSCQTGRTGRPNQLARSVLIFVNFGWKQEVNGIYGWKFMPILGTRDLLLTRKLVGADSTQSIASRNQLRLVGFPDNQLG